MRINYYEFPESVNDATRIEYGCDTKSGCSLDIDKDMDAAGWQCERGWCYECDKCITKSVDYTLSGISVTTAKNLLESFGGSAWTCHFDRDGGLFETTEIKIKGNNSRHKYNKHL